MKLSVCAGVAFAALMTSTANAAVATYSFTKIADASGAFSGFGGGPSVNSSGAVASQAGLDAGGQSLNVFSCSIQTTILSTGDALDGLVISSLFFGPEGLNDNKAPTSCPVANR